LKQEYGKVYVSSGWKSLLYKSGSFIKIQKELDVVLKKNLAKVFGSKKPRHRNVLVEGHLRDKCPLEGTWGPIRRQLVD